VFLLRPPSQLARSFAAVIKCCERFGSISIRGHTQHGKTLHHLAYRIPETGPELEKYRKLWLEEVARGKLPKELAHWSTFHYVYDPKGGVVIEFNSRIPRR
jgi:hypothetical protein